MTRVSAAVRACVAGKAHRWRCEPPAPEGVRAVCRHCGAERSFRPDGRGDHPEAGWVLRGPSRE